MTFVIPSKEAWKDAKASMDSVANKIVVFGEDKKGLPVVHEKYGPTVSINGEAVKKLSKAEKSQLGELIVEAFFNEVENNNDGWYSNKFLKECAKQIGKEAWNACKASKAGKPKKMSQAEVAQAQSERMDKIEQMLAVIAESMVGKK